MKQYEFVLVTKTSMADKEREKLLETIKGWLKDFKVTNEDVWGQKPLAYKIKRELAGYYNKFELESDKPMPADFERKLVNNENVLRYLVLRKN